MSHQRLYKRNENYNKNKYEIDDLLIKKVVSNCGNTYVLSCAIKDLRLI